MKRLTAKQRVLRKWPLAYSFEYQSLGWNIYPAYGTPYLDSVGSGDTENAAWADAARRLKNG